MRDKSPQFDDADDVETIHEVEYFKEDEPVTLADMEREMIRKTLEKHRGRRKPAAEELQISERTLYRKIKDYEIDI